MALRYKNLFQISGSHKHPVTTYLFFFCVKSLFSFTFLPPPSKSDLKGEDDQLVFHINCTYAESLFSKCNIHKLSKFQARFY